MENEQAARAWSHHRDQARAFLTSRLRTPRTLDPLAREVHDELREARTRARTWRDYRCQLWRLAEWSKSVNACRESSSFATALEHLRPHLEHAQGRLPLAHAQILSAAKEERLSLRSIAARHAMSEQLIEQHLSQAIALVRTLTVAAVESDPELVLVSRREILTAQDAAYWVVRGTYDPALPVEQLMLWLRRRALHVREFFIAWQWNDVLESS